jgi:hypothetical protein
VISGQYIGATVGHGDWAWAVVVVRREYRALGRELRHGPALRHRSLLGRMVGWVLRHLPEILLLMLLVHLWRITAKHSNASYFEPPALLSAAASGSTD